MKKLIATIQSSIWIKLMSVFCLITVIVLVTSLLVNAYMNRSMAKVNHVYASNISTNELVHKLGKVQSEVYAYLNTKSSKSLENYYRSEQEYRSLYEVLNDRIINDKIKMLEKNIRNMSESYLDLTDETIKEKRGRNIEKYKETYLQAKSLCQYITSYINELNQIQFEKNSSNYKSLVESFHYTQMLTIGIMIVVDIISLCLLLLILKNLIDPLVHLAHNANDVANGNFNTKILVSSTKDEVGILGIAFESMLKNINQYIQQMKENAEHEQLLIKRQLLMETHLKDAQLKYLKAQINPHFLFNSLNAGAQLALLEDAEQTSLFVQKMADFFRYNLKKIEEDASLHEEIDTVDNYIYILNVRFAGEIHYEKQIQVTTDKIRVPSMILQPIVENAVNHGIRNINWEKKICLKVIRVEQYYLIEIIDNGVGMTEERIEEVFNPNQRKEKRINQNQKIDSTEVGLDNVRKRLELYYEEKDLLKIESKGRDQGTKVSLIIPQRCNTKGEQLYVSDSISR